MPASSESAAADPVYTIKRYGTKVGDLMEAVNTVCQQHFRKTPELILVRPLDFIARLVALVPKPRVNRTRFHGVFAPNSTHRSQVTPARRGKGNTPNAPGEGPQKTPAERHAAMSL